MDETKPFKFFFGEQISKYPFPSYAGFHLWARVFYSTQKSYHAEFPHIVYAHDIILIPTIYCN